MAGLIRLSKGVEDGVLVCFSVKGSAKQTTNAVEGNGSIDLPAFLRSQSGRVLLVDTTFGNMVVQFE